MRKLMTMLVLAACAPDTMTTKEGCSIGVTDIGIARQNACVAAYYEEQARMNGGTVTRCTQVGQTMSCVTN